MQMLTTNVAPSTPIDASRLKAELQLARARRANTRAIVAALLASSFSAFLTGLPSALGHPVVGTWRVTCMVAAALAVIAAITTGLQAQLRYADRLAAATDCLGRLRALEVQQSLGTLSKDDLARQFADIVTRYPEYA
jgi:hypothetical protein